MPTYQYACTECGHRFEAVQSFTDDALSECPACAGRLRKVFNAVGVVFKGSGFYRNDSRESPKPASGSDKPADKPSEKSGERQKGDATTTKSDAPGPSSPSKPSAGSSSTSGAGKSSSTAGSAA